MFDIGWTELLLIGIVALIVVGPKDLPIMFRTLGQFTGKARRMAREFQKAMEDAADETGVKDVSRDLKSMTSARKLGLDKLQDAARSFENWEPGKKARGSAKPGTKPAAAAKPASPGPAKPAEAGATAKQAESIGSGMNTAAQAEPGAASGAARPAEVPAPLAGAEPAPRETRDS